MHELFLALLFLIGAVLGSFGNVLVLRLPSGHSLGGRSHCDGCGRVLGGRDLIPIVGALLQRGRARCCGVRFGWQYTLWEAVTALIFVLAGMVAPGEVEALVAAAALWLLIIIARIDAATQTIPDVLNILLILVGGLLSVLYGELPLASVAFVLLVFGGQWYVSRGRWIGSGDVFLVVGIALLLRTVDRALLFTLLAYIVGGVVAAVLLARRSVTLGGTIAFGPFLCAAAIITALVGDRLLALL